MRIGIDFDSTIAGYDVVFLEAARRARLVDAYFAVASGRCATRSGAPPMATPRGSACRLACMAPGWLARSRHERLGPRRPNESATCGC
jgi:hypothetical protein